jgi:phage terminase large subunit GpA-like protein
MTEGEKIVYAAFARGLQPDPDMTVDKWADEYMVIPKSTGASEYGKYRTSRTPHARLPMLALSDNHPCKRVVLMGASQMLKTQVGLNWFAASVHQSPGNFLWILPTGKLAKRTSIRIANTITAVPELQERIAAPRSRDSVNTLDTKEYIGGSLFIVTAGAAANLSEVPARRVLFDEVDRAEANINGEGNPVALAEARQTTFQRNRKSYYPSTPTIADESIIEKLYEAGTRQEALADCVHCGHAQTLIFERLVLSDDGQTALYPCIECGLCMVESDKTRMFQRGAWSEGVPGDGETVSFTINALFLPYGWMPWLALLQEYAKAKAARDEGSDEAMITFYNTRLARVWRKDAEQTSADALLNRREPYKLGTVPAGGCRLTAAIDTQAYRLEMKVVAWGESMECWIVDYQVIQGSPDEADTWHKAETFLRGKYRHAHGQMVGISATFIDSGGTATQDVYNFARGRSRNHIYPIKGHSKPNRPILSLKPSIVDFNWRGQTEVRGVKLWFIGTDTAKDYLAARWAKSSGAGAVHFSQDLDADYFNQLTAEYRTGGFKRGFRKSWWEKKANAANEALDLMIYNLAAAHYLGLHKLKPGHWQTLRDALNPNHGDLFGPAPDTPETAAETVSGPGNQKNSESAPKAAVLSPRTAALPSRPTSFNRDW